MLKKFIISAPFGNFLNFDNCTSTLGTFTWHPRPGRLFKIFSTIRYNWRQQSWINKIGLRNPGIKTVGLHDYKDKIISIYGFNEAEWLACADYLIMGTNVKYVEFNLSCPNIDHDISEFYYDSRKAIEYCLRKNIEVIAKLSPLVHMAQIRMLHEDYGIKYFHLCNTLPSPGGGISGQPLRMVSAGKVLEARSTFSDKIKIIGGGGIRHQGDIALYNAVGADHYAIGSALFNPFNWKRIKSLV